VARQAVGQRDELLRHRAALGAIGTEREGVAGECLGQRIG
jgi:hypothetical protein